MRRPLLGMAFFYLAGILGGVWIDELHFITVLAFALLALIIALGLHYIIQRHEMTAWTSRLFPVSTGFIYLAVFLAGWLTIDLRLNNPSERYISALMDRPREGVEIIGVIADDPAPGKGRQDDHLFWSFAMRLEALSRLGFFQKARGEVMVTMPQDETRPRYGERWRLSGALIDRAFSSGSDGFHRMDTVRNSIPGRFLFQVDQEPAGQVRRISPPAWDIRHGCFLLRQKCADLLARGIDHRPDVAGILQALLLGRRYELPADLRAAFTATGTYHVFAISGQHVAIIAMFVVVVLQASGVGRLYWFYYLAPVLIVFTIMSGLSASAVRGCIMAFMCFLGPVFKRRTDIASAMALAALLITGADPLQLFQPGFILSFGIVAGLIVLCPPLIAMVESKIAPDPYRLEPENLPARKARGALRWILFMLAASFAAWAVSLPLIARWFNLVSPVALPANLIVIPLTTIVLLTGCLSIVFGFFSPFIAEVFNFANIAFVSFTTGVTKVLAQVPGGHIFARSPPLWFVFVWLFILLVWRIYYAKSVSYYQKIKVCLAAVLALIIAGGLAWQLNKNEWEVHVFNIDQCAVCLITKAGSNPLLLNTGPRYQSRNVLRYLRKMGVNRLQALACPMADAKHIGGATDIIAALPVGGIWCNAGQPGTRLLKELRSEAEKRRIGVGELAIGATPVGGQVWQIKLDGNGWSMDIFGGGIQTQMTARILILTEQPPLAIDIEEAPVSGMNNAGLAMPGQCRIICCPISEDRARTSGGQPVRLSSAPLIFLGPKQGILLLPGMEKDEIKAVNLDLSAGSR